MWDTPEWKRNETDGRRFVEVCWHEAGHALATLELKYAFQIATAVDPERHWVIKGFVQMPDDHKYRSDENFFIQKASGVAGQILRRDRYVMERKARRQAWKLFDGCGLRDRSEIGCRLAENGIVDADEKKEPTLGFLMKAIELLQSRYDDLEKIAIELGKGEPLGHQQAVDLLAK